MNDTGLVLVLRHTYDLTLVLGLLALGAAVGLRLMRLIGVASLRGAEPVLFATPLGLGAVATGVLVLGWVRGLHPIIITSMIGGLAILVRAELRQLPARCREVIATLAIDPTDRWFSAVALAVSGAVAAFLLALTVAPPTDWDALMYHLQVPRHFLDTGRLVIPPDNLHAAFVGMAHLLYVPLLALGSAAGAGLLSAALALLLALGVYALGLRAFGRPTANLSLPMLWGTATLVLVAITPRVDVTLACYVFFAHYALLIAVSEHDDRAGWLAGAILGLAIGLKYQAVAYAVALAPLALWPASGIPPLHRVRRLAHLALVATLVAAPWYVKNWILLGAPVYPFLAEVRLEPWLAELHGSAFAPADLTRDAFASLRSLRVPFNVLDAFFAPQLLTLEGEGVFYRLNPLLLVLPVSLLMLRRRATAGLVAPAAIYLAIVILASPETNLRYLLPAVAPLTLVAADTLAVWAPRLLPDARVRAVAVTVLLVGGLYWTGQVMYRWVRYTEAVPHLVGARSGWSFLRSHVDPTIRFAAPTMERVNSTLPDDSRVLMLFEARGFHYRVDVLQDNRLTNWLLLSGTDAPSRCLSGTGITHVLLAGEALRYYVRRGLDPAQLGWTTFPSFYERCLDPVFEQHGYTLFAVRPALDP